MATNKEHAENLATILAALRLFQDTFEDFDGDAVKASKYGAHFADAMPLSTDDIEILCERLNSGEIQLCEVDVCIAGNAAINGKCGDPECVCS